MSVFEIEQERAEFRRQERHHDVLCLVLKELVDGIPGKHPSTVIGEHVLIARAYADLAYPPPKAEGIEGLKLNAGSIAPPFPGNVIAHNTPKAEGT